MIGLQFYPLGAGSFNGIKFVAENTKRASNVLKTGRGVAHIECLGSLAFQLLNGLLAMSLP